MTFISYAQNFEDVMLWRALKNIENGFYIDVGAWSPDLDSVTRAFYENGWHGINIEPNPEFNRALNERRPKDINLRIAVSDREGLLTMNFLGNSGLSTLDDEIAGKHQQQGVSLERQEIQVTTLEKICIEHVPSNQAVHFLKIDVEGLEEAVLRGNNWLKNRPWVVVVEATLPMSQVESYVSWEPILLEANYKFAFADGLNRFYIANEHSDLMVSFKYPPNVFDEFILVGQQQAEVKYQLAEAKAQQLSSKLENIYNSASWRITKPLRNIRKFTQKAINFVCAGLKKSLLVIARFISKISLIRRVLLKFNTVYPFMGKWLFSAEGLYRNLKPQGNTLDIFVDVTHVYKKDLKTGIQRAVRAISLELENIVSDYGYKLWPVFLTDADNYWHFEYISKDNFERNGVVVPKSGDIFLGLDFNAGISAASYAGLFDDWKRRETKIAFIIYDTMPVKHPEWWETGVSIGHKIWLASVFRESDKLICISKKVMNDVSQWASKNKRIKKLPQLNWFHLGADLENSQPTKGLPPSSDAILGSLKSKPTFLMVGTLEPRKGYKQVLAAFELIWTQNYQLNLVIVGKSGWMVDDLTQLLKSHSEAGQRLFWFNGISDQFLEELYKHSDCLIAASFDEGFGLPLIEAALHKLPIMARDTNVFREVAGHHAYYFKASTSEELAESIKSWLHLYNTNSHPRSDHMPWLTWQESAASLMEIVLGETESGITKSSIPKINRHMSTKT